MQALILCAGRGTRLKSITNKIPKVMVDIRGRPLLEYQILLLKKNGVSEIYINLFTYPDKICSYFGNGKKFGVKIAYSREDKAESYQGPLLLGTAGALHNFKKKLKNDFFILYGDVFMNIDLKKMLKFHKSKKSPFTLAVHQARHPEDSDLVATNRRMRIVKWIKKPHGKKQGVNSAGLYIINASILKDLPAKVPLDFAEDFIPLLLAKKIPLYAYFSEELMMDIGTRERYDYLIKTGRSQSA